MSQPNHFQPWKQGRPLGIPMPNPTTISAHGKLPAAAHQNLHSIHQPQPATVLHGHQTLPRGPPVGLPPPIAVQTAAASSSTSAISSSTGLSGSGGGIGGMSDFLSQLGADKLMLSKLTASYGITNLATGDQLAGGQQQQSLQLQQQQHQQQQPSPLDDCANDKERELRIQQIFENAIGDNSKKQIVDILEKISNLRPPERLLLYLRMPGGYPETDPLRQSQNPLGTRSEINHTINWVRSHLEPDPNVSIPKQEVYEDYTAYCERIDIKPLSTADFGKVMKQVFPGIRPRRLGTRGHSRYCYAAMRKATKLAAPKLPDLITSTGEKPPPEDHVPSDEEAWKVIKVWAEAMLPNSFGSINELASFITKNNLNSPASIASRQLLQKKLLQREIKERKKLTAAALKKRRRKRRKTLSTSMDSEVGQSEPQPSSSSVVSTQLPSSRDHIVAQQTTSANPAVAPATSGSPSALLHQIIKHERQDFTDDDNNNTSVGIETMKQQQQQQQQQQPPLHQQRHPSTNLNCDTGNGVLAATPAVAASVAGNAVTVTGREMRSPAEEYNIFCKKVRQAQQLKAAAQNQPLSIIPSSSLRPPSAAAKRAASIAHLTRQKRFRMLQQQQQRAIEAQNNSAPHYDEMGNLILIESQDLVTSSKEDFIIPRERVISICNMDKNALDDYLNCEEENSQDQDQELLQYFPEENNPDGPPVGPMTSSSGSNAVSSVGQAGGGYGGIFDDSDTNLKLSQLRSMLEQNMAQSGGIDKPQVGGQLDGFDATIGGQQLGLQPGSAAASLAMLSQRHHGNGVASTDGASCTNMDTKKNSTGGMKLSLENCFNNIGNGSAVGTAANGGTTLQSPNGRRKNYNFVPISAGPQSPRVLPQARQPVRNGTPNASPFVSPRNTPIHRKTKPANNGLTLNILQQNQQSIQLSGYQQRASYIKNELSASAPPSPSLAQNYRFGLNPGPLNTNTMPSFQPICNPSTHMQSQQNLVNSLESRSSSVPLIPNYDGYNHSNFTSVSQTPAPSECDDFSDPNNILDMLNEPSSNNLAQSIKLEASDPMMSDILETDDIFPKAPYSSVSRSVPSTPLPHQMSYNQTNPNCAAMLGSNGLSSKSLFELPKSVPTTPITLNNGRDQLFQYSPETPRDCLINGNSIERGGGKMTSFYQQNQTANNIAGTDGTSVNVSVKATDNPAAPPPSTGSGTEMSVLGEGIESLTDAFIGSDTLRYL
ncbi:uncharacterized protein LOC128740957 [Sabethes cyaneus]|uniref:uncharacterized protein LOC128740957 n=1 Tax=Sabethes cyaneus TaxID=53552 RepID=UPI00237EB409|nr:uncharacterized protein LOC128740957 [Sabethes cyaneus]